MTRYNPVPMRHLTTMLLLGATALAQAPAAPTPDPLEIARAFADQLQSTIETGDASLYRSRLDLDSILDRALADYPDSPELQRYRSTLRTAPGFVEGVRRALAAGGSYRCLRLHREGEELRALFRLTSVQGLNYHDLILDVSDPDAVRITDVYVYLRGELLSEIVRRGALAHLETSGADDPVARKLRLVSRLAEIGRPGQAVRVWYQLPEPRRRQKHNLLILINVASQAGPEAYEQALTLYQEALPDDPSLDLLLIDKHVASEEYEPALACARRLDAAVGGDPRLLVLQADITARAGDLDQAAHLAREALAQDEQLPDAHLTLVKIAVEQGEYAEAARRLVTLEEEVGFRLPANLQELLEAPDLQPLEPFLKSEAGRAWLEERQSR
jgi:tetratricopeptide (TPR) repeat protein